MVILLFTAFSMYTHGFLLSQVFEYSFDFFYYFNFLYFRFSFPYSLLMFRADLIYDLEGFYYTDCPCISFFSVLYFGLYTCSSCLAGHLRLNLLKPICVRQSVISNLGIVSFICSMCSPWPDSFFELFSDWFF